MSLERKCNNCNSIDITKTESKNLANLFAGAGFGYLISSSDTNVGPIMALAGGIACYLTDFPLEPRRKYSCKECNYQWKGT